MRNGFCPQQLEGRASLADPPGEIAEELFKGGGHGLADGIMGPKELHHLDRGSKLLHVSLYTALIMPDGGFPCCALPVRLKQNHVGDHPLLNGAASHN